MFPEVPIKFRVSGGLQESRLIMPLGLEYPWVDWERGILQSRTQFQKLNILLQGLRLVL